MSEGAKPKYASGGYIKHYCNRCGLDLGHTIIAVMNGVPVRVRCDTCKSERNYKAPKPLQDARERPTRIVRALQRSGTHNREDFYEQKLRDSAMKTPRTYDAREIYTLGDVVDHPKFGRGVVTKLIFPDRMDVVFRNEAKTLLCKHPEQS